ncbi:MAG: hypothetical protein AMXMBFR82_13240 [Candidatus Hydrogenedentota bacterium]
MDESNVATSRYSRLWLVGLLVLTAVVAGGALYAKYRLEGLRGVLLETARTRTGAHLEVEEVTAFGLRGLRAEGVELRYPTASYGEFHVTAPEAVVYIDLLDLLAGDISVEHIRLDGAAFRVRRDPDNPWFSPDVPSGSERAGSRIPFRLTGSGCTLVVENVVRDTRLELTSLNLDIARLTGSSSVTGTIDGDLAGDEDKGFNIDVQYSSATSFDLRIQCDEISAEDVNVFLPASQRIVRTGSAAPIARLAGNENGSISLSLESLFEDLQVRDQPDYLPPVTGALSAYGTYHPDTRTLRLSMASADTETLAGNLSGSVAFSNEVPVLDLTFTSSRLPVREILSSVLADRLEQFGEIEYTVDELEECMLTLTGTTENPVIRTVAAAQGGAMTFRPANSTYPGGELRLGRFEVAWDSESKQPSGTIPVLDGKIVHKTTGLEATGLAGRVTLEAGAVQVNPLNATFMGQPMMLTGSYDLDTKTGSATVAGSLTAIEDSKLASTIRNAELAGSGVINAKVKFTEKKVEFEADIDATQTEIGYRWWFLKPVGIGANGQVTGTFTPRRSVECTIQGLIAGTELAGTTSLYHDGAKWRLKQAEARSESVDVVSVGKCLPLPYTITGGKGSNGTYVWERDEASPDGWRSRFTCDIDRISLQADTSEVPIALKGVRLEGGMASGSEETGELTIHVESGETPPIRGGTWFAPLERDFEKYPPVDRRWTYRIAAEQLTVPPWRGTNFNGEGFATLTEVGLRHYEAVVDEGRVSGSYISHRKQNSFESEASWEGIPAAYMMDTLDLPHVFRGNMSGKIAYSQDRDDPGTLQGKGYFTMGEGQFSADYLLAMLEQQMESSEVSSLPPSLKFSSLEADVEFEKDVVRTPRIELTSDAMRMQASGQFVTDGDMNYGIQIAVTPDAAERIPLLAENFNVQGHRLAQQDIELAFTLSGPTFKPVSSLAETPPVHVTLVSGALEAANEAFRVIDAPRKILVDLLKIGGGIVGARKPASSGSSK